jgi:hypothetical protein
MTENDITYFFQIIVVVTFFIWIFLVSKISYFYLVTIKKWQKAEAKIVECEIKWFRSETDADTEGWKEMIKYNYVVNSIKYENDCVTKNIGVLSPFKNIARKYNFIENQKIEIAFDPTNPKNSIIDTQLNYLTVIIPIGFYIVVYLFLFNNNVV